jgi:hypothetical protein
METYSELVPHSGQAVVAFSSTYGSLLEVNSELSQNAVDNNPKNIWISLNLKNRTGSVRDDGDGVSVEYFEEALRRVGRPKTAAERKKDDKMGRFRRGLVSPLGKCSHWTFTSTPRGKVAEYTEWKFSPEVIESHERILIPKYKRKDLRYGDGKSSKGVSYVNWRSETRMYGIKDNRIMNQVSLDSLCEAISQGYNEALKKNGTVVHVTVVDENGIRDTRDVCFVEYGGTPLPPVRISNPESGDTTLRMYLARPGKKGLRGVVKIGEAGDKFRVKFDVFRRHLPDGVHFSGNVGQALASGIFEGEILSSRCKLAEHRKCFEAENPLLGFIVAIEEWFDKTGSKYYDHVDQERKGQKYQRMTIEDLALLRELSNSDSGKAIRSLINTLSVGSIGEGHFSRRTIGDAQPGVQALAPPSPVGADQPEPDYRPKKEHKGHTPFVAGGPNAKPRKGVKDSSLGITVIHEPLAINKLWEFDDECGVLALNTRNPHWAECEDKGDRVLSRFQRYLLVQALTAHSIKDDEQRTMAIMQVEEATPAYAWMLTHESIIPGGSKPPEKKKTLVVKAK